MQVVNYMREERQPALLSKKNWTNQELLKNQSKSEAQFMQVELMQVQLSKAN